LRLPNIEAWIQSLGFPEVGATKKRNIQGHKEPAEPIGKFEIRTTEEPARFWPAQKVSEVYFLETDMQDTV
jgi:hypothetical protein